jgi:hypothetical protein
MTRGPVLAFVLALAAACGGGGATGDGGAPDAGVGEAADVFARDLIEIRIDIDPTDWEAMRVQQKTRHSAFGRADCRNMLIPNPYTWFSATVTIDGEELPFTGVRKKGHVGSQSSLIPSMKLRFDEFVGGQTLHGLERLALNNSKSDPSYARTCLGYRMFAAAGLPASRCTFAHVVVNGNDLGPYIAVEEVDEQYLARNFERADGNLYEGTANDFRSDAIGGFEQETNQDSDPSHADLQAVLDALSASDAQLRERLAPLVDLDLFVHYWAVESLIWHRDGYSGNTNNFFVYADPGNGGRLAFLPWGPDAVLHYDTRDTVPDSVLAFGVLANRLYAISDERGRFYDDLGKLFDNHWKPARLIADADRVSGIVRPLLPAGAREEHDVDLADLEAFIDGRRAAVEAITADAYPDWTDGLRVLPCTVPVGPVSGTFNTTWDTLAVTANEAGRATIDLVLDGETIAPTLDGSRAGFTADAKDRVQMIFELPDQRRMTFTVNMSHDRWWEPYLVPGVHPLTTPPAPMSLIYQDVSVTPARTIQKYEIGEGTITFDQIDPTPGGAVVGSFEGTLYVLAANL